MKCRDAEEGKKCPLAARSRTCARGRKKRRRQRRERTWENCAPSTPLQTVIAVKWMLSRSCISQVSAPVRAHVCVCLCVSFPSRFVFSSRRGKLCSLNANAPFGSGVFRGRSALSRSASRACMCVRESVSPPGSIT